MSVEPSVQLAVGHFAGSRKDGYGAPYFVFVAFVSEPVDEPCGAGGGVLTDGGDDHQLVCGIKCRFPVRGAHVVARVHNNDPVEPAEGGVELVEGFRVDGGRCGRVFVGCEDIELG